MRSLLVVALFLVACGPKPPPDAASPPAPTGPEPPATSEPAPSEPPPTTSPQCGGIAGLRCPSGQECVDDPGDGCDPDKGGRDCGGVCRASAGGEPCGKTACAPGQVCCNKSCGICTPPEGVCTQQFCE